MSINAKAALAKDQAIYNSLKASCDGKKQARVQAQSLLDAAKSAWRTRWAATTKYRVVNFPFTETLKGFPIGNYDQLNAFAFRSGMACQN